MVSIVRSAIVISFACLLHISNLEANELEMPRTGGARFILAEEGEDFYFKSGNSSTHVWIRIKPYGLRFDFSDSSYLELNANNSTIKRYSSLDNHIESYSVNSSVSDWNVPRAIENLIEEMGNYVDVNHDFTPELSGGDCQWVHGRYLCTPPIVGPGPLSSTSTITQSSSNSCQFERSQAAKPYAGHSSWNRCLLASRLTYATAGTATFYGCLAGPGQCAALFIGFQAATISLYDRVTECQQSYDTALHNLQRCELHGQSPNNPAWSAVGSDGFTTSGGTTVIYGGYKFGAAGSRTCTITIKGKNGNILSQTKVRC